MRQYSLQMARRVLGWMLLAALALSAAARAQEAPPLKAEEIEALVAPIALYPDTVLSQVLMASTYPLEVVQAARWVKANPNVKGEAAVKAVEKEAWDVSVKSLVAFPQVLEPMNDKIDWTQKLGDAVLADQKAVLDAVQRLRSKAEQSGNLKSNEQQKVIIEQAPQQQVIVIESASPEVIYVPAYNPTVVYGAWAYPAYPPYYWAPYPHYYPGGALAAGFAWGVGIAAAGAIFGDCNWGHGDIDIDIDRSTNIDRNSNRSTNRSNTGGGKWQHDSSHRKGVSYRDSASRSKYGRDVPGADGRRDFRGRDGGVSDRAGAADRGGDRDRAGASDRGGMGDRSGPGVADRAGSADRGGSRDSGAFQGVGGGSASQRDFNRGSASNQSFSSNRGSSAGARSGSFGGRSGGGGRGGRR
jgi:hypothetical protein